MFLGGFATNRGADQPAHPRCLISAFVIRCLESIISKLTTNGDSIILLAYVAKQAGLNLTLLETLKSGFVALIDRKLLIGPLPQGEFCTL